MLIQGQSASGARPKNIRYTNCRSLVDLLSQSDKLSVHEISEQLDLSKTATINIMNILVSTGIIYGCGKGASSESGGKKPALYAINPSYKYSIIVSFAEKFVVAEMLDFCFNKVNYCLQATDDSSYKAVVDAAASAITYLLEHSSLSPDSLYAVAVQSGGIVDAMNGILLRPITAPDWGNDLPLVEDLKKALRFEVPVYFDNVCRFGGYFELLKNPKNRNRTILSLYINDAGVGGSLIQNGAIAHGKYGLIGEFGHITTDYTSAEKCKCGRYGCFETVVTGMKVVERARKALPGTKGTVLTEETLKKIADIFAAADQGDGFAQSQMDFVVDQFANMLYNMQIMYDPDTVIIQGAYANSGTYFKDKLALAVEDISLFSIAKSLRLIFDENNFRDAVTLGSSFFCREQYLNNGTVFEGR